MLLVHALLVASSPPPLDGTTESLQGDDQGPTSPYYIPPGMVWETGKGYVPVPTIAPFASGPRLKKEFAQWPAR